MSARLDIVIPVYNEGPNILATLGSLRNNVRTPMRILICYDQPDDDTLATIDANRATLQGMHIEYVRNPGRGAHDAVMAGFAASTGPYVIVLPADDDFNGGIIDGMVAKAEQGGSIFDRVNKVTNTKPTDEEAQKLKLNLDNLQGQCRARFPAAAGNVAPTLPSDPVDRADWCLMAATFTESLVQGGVRLTDAERQHVADVKRTAVANFSDAALMAKGFTTQQQVTDYSQKQAETMMGNRIDKVLDACPTS